MVPLAVVITVGMLIVIAVIQGFSLGASTVITAVVSFVLVTFLTAGLSTISRSTVPTSLPYSANPISAMETLANQTTKVYPANSSSTPPGAPPGAVQSTGWNSNHALWALGIDIGTGLIGGLDDGAALGVEVLFSPQIWKFSLSDPYIAEPFLVGMSLANCFLAALVDAFDAAYSNSLLEEVALVLSFTAVALDAGAWLVMVWEPALAEGGDWVMTDGFVTAVDAAVLYASVQNYDTHGG